MQMWYNIAVILVHMYICVFKQKNVEMRQRVLYRENENEANEGRVYENKFDIRY